MEKIAFVCQRYGEEVNGGAELYCRQVAEHLAGHYEVDVYTTCAVDYITWNNEYPAGESTLNGVHIRRWPVQFPRQRIIQGICGRWIRYSPVHSSALERRWIRAQGPVCDAALDALWEHQGEYRAIFFMTYLYYLTAMGVPRGFRNALLIPTLHDEWPAYLRHYDRVFRGAKGIVWNSREELEFAEKRFPGIGTVPGVITGIGIEVPEELKVPDRIRDMQDPYVVYVGRVDESKGCGEMFRYFEEYKKRCPGPLKLVLIGKVNMPVPQREDILPLGFVSEQEKFGVMQKARGLVLCSRFESLSMVVLESMLLGRPVLVNGACEVLRGHVTRSGAGIAYDSPEAFARGLEALQTEDEAYRGMAEKGQRYVQENYRWDVIEDKYLRFIETTCGR